MRKFPAAAIATNSEAVSNRRAPKSGRRYLAVLAAAAGLAMLGGTAQSLASVTHTQAHVQDAGNPSGITGGVLFGGDQNLVHEEGQIGRTLGVVRLYDHIGEPFPLKVDTTLMASGHTLLVSLDSAGQSYASIAAGNEDAAITTFLTTVNQEAIKYNLKSIYVSFEHEPDSQQHQVFGTPAQFIQAWDHVHQLAADAGLNWNAGGRLHWAWIMIRTSFNNSWASQFWPGSSNVDIIAIDGYNSPGCSGGKPNATPSTIFGTALAFDAAQGSPPVFISEWGSTNNPGGTQATYINQMQSYIAANPAIAAALYWDTGVPTCDYSINANPASVSAMTTLGQSALMQGQLG